MVPPPSACKPRPGERCNVDLVSCPPARWECRPTGTTWCRCPAPVQVKGGRISHDGWRRQGAGWLCCTSVRARAIGAPRAAASSAGTPLPDPQANHQTGIATHLGQLPPAQVHLQQVQQLGHGGEEQHPAASRIRRHVRAQHQTAAARHATAAGWCWRRAAPCGLHGLNSNAAMMKQMCYGGQRRGCTAAAVAASDGWRPDAGSASPSLPGAAHPTGCPHSGTARAHLCPLSFILTSSRSSTIILPHWRTMASPTAHDSGG